VADAIARVNAAGPISVPAPKVLSATDVARMIDHTLLKPDAVSEQVLELCEQARRYNFASVCVHGVWAPLCVEVLAESGIKVAAVAGFPQGATLPAVKAFEAQQLMALGVAEIDMVMNVGKLKDGDYRLVFEDVAGVADECHEGGGLLKVILETALLTHEEKIAACVICKEAGADFVKTATGFNGGGATVEDIALMRFVVGPQMGVKAAGGVRTRADALAMLSAGANRIGTSGGLRIVQELLAAEAGEDSGALEATSVRGDAY
jgi:deoxyribose-phosphate aldolase